MSLSVVDLLLLLKIQFFMLNENGPTKYYFILLAIYHIEI